MPARKELVEQLIQALKDDSVLAAIGSVVERKLTDLLEAVNDQKAANDEKTLQLVAVEADLKMANDRIEALESYSRQSNVIICGLPPSNFAAAIGGNNDDSPASAMNSAATKDEVLKLFNDNIKATFQQRTISVKMFAPQPLHRLLFIVI